MCSDTWQTSASGKWQETDHESQVSSVHGMEDVFNNIGMVKFVSGVLGLQSRSMRQALRHIETMYLDVGWLFPKARRRMNVHMVISEGDTYLFVSFYVVMYDASSPQACPKVGRGAGAI